MEPDEPVEKPAEDLAGTVRWLGRGVVVAVALWLIMDGLRETWAPAAVIATVLVWIGIGLAVAFAAVATRYLARRGRSGG
jgi:hypothetical protein